MFKDRLKELRKEKGLSQQELANAIYVSRSAICKWEMGNGVPSESNIEALCSFFEVEEEWLFDRKDLKDGIEITKSNQNVNIINVILIALTINFLNIIFSILLNSDIISNGKQPMFIWKLFNAYELLIFIGSIVVSCWVGVLLILNNNGFLTLNIDDEKRKKMLQFGYVLSIVSFLIFMIYLLLRLSKLNDYIFAISNKMIFEDIILTIVIGLVPLAYILSNQKLRKFEIVFSVLNYMAFSIAALFFVYCLIQFKDDNSLAVILGFLINSIFGLASIIISSIGIFFGFKSKGKNKILTYINASTILLSIIMFVIIITVFL